MDRTLELVREIEGRSLRAWPPTELLDVDGWQVRFAAGYTGRANSVNPFGPSRGDPEASLRRCEDLFRARELRTVFRITPLVDPPGLEDLLDRRGYVRRSDTVVMVRDGVSDAGAPPESPEGADAELVFSERVDADWLERISKWAGVPAGREPLHRAILEGIRPPAAFARLRSAGRDAACGLAVCEPPWVGLFDLATDPGLRSRGLGTRLVRGLLAWGADAGAGRAYLQVVGGNDGAIRLYRRLGFRRAYPYWYRVSTEPGPWKLPKSPD